MERIKTQHVWRKKVKWYRRIDWRSVTIGCMALMVYAFMWYTFMYVTATMPMESENRGPSVSVRVIR